MDHPQLEIIDLHRAERGQKKRHDGFFGFFRMVAAMRAAHVDEVWVLHKSWRYAVAALLAGIPKRAGYGFGKQRYALNHKKPLPLTMKKSHPRETVAAFLAQFNIIAEDTNPHITPNEESRKMAQSLVPSTPFIIMGIGAADAIRRWSPKRFASLITRLHQSHPKVKIMLCGSPLEAPLGYQVLSHLEDGVTAPQLMFDQQVSTVIAVHEKAILYIGNDTSLINIAVAVGTKAIRIFASNLPVLNSNLIETHLPEDPKRMDQEGAIDDVDDARIHRAAMAYLPKSKQQ